MPMNFLKTRLRVKVSYTDSNEASCYDPSSHEITISEGAIAKLARNAVGRDKKWTLGHELGHAFLQECSDSIVERLEEVFGSFDEDDYSSNPFREALAKIRGFNKGRYISARATLCPEEDFAECCAYLYTGGPVSSQSKWLQKKLRAVVSATSRASKKA